jgi:hypothetical protein
MKTSALWILLLTTAFLASEGPALARKGGGAQGGDRSSLVGSFQAKVKRASDGLKGAWSRHRERAKEMNMARDASNAYLTKSADGRLYFEQAQQEEGGTGPALVVSAVGGVVSGLAFLAAAPVGIGLGVATAFVGVRMYGRAQDRAMIRMAQDRPDKMPPKLRESLTRLGYLD